MNLRKAPLLGLAELLGGTGQPKPSRLRQLHALQWVATTAQGVEVTPEGHEALRAGAIEAEAIGSEALGNYNAARERGKLDAAERHLARSQLYLDLANVFRRKS